MPPPAIQLHTLYSADGSATYQSNVHTIICGVNYPLEVQYRSKEIPESTYIEVHIRPHNGVAGVRERHVESVVKRVLESIVLGEETPRCMLQATLQVTEVSEDESLPGGVKSGAQGESYLALLAGSINAAVAGCLDAGVQMRSVAGAAIVVVGQSGKTLLWPDAKQVQRGKSLHVFAFGREGECLLMESEGRFSMDEWETAEGVARHAIMGAVDGKDNGDGDASITDEGNKADSPILGTMRRAVEARVEKDGRWRG